MSSLDQITKNLSDLKFRITEARKRCQNLDSALTLVAVSKQQSVEQMLAYQQCLADEVAVFGENYVQEFKRKRESLTLPYRVHFIGRLQRNKARDAVRLFDLIESLDSAALAKTINAEAKKLGKTQEVFLQANISNDPDKTGFAREALIEFISSELKQLSNLRWSGLMTITKLYEDPEQARPDFKALRMLRDEILSDLDLREALEDRVCELSMGMSADFEIAIEEGASVIRVGTAIFGARPE